MTNLRYRFDRSLVMSAAAVGVIVLSANSIAQQRGRGPVAATISPTAVQEAQQTIDRAAAKRGLVLTNAAKEALAKEAIREEAADPASNSKNVTGALSDEKVTRLLAPLANPAATQITDQDVRTSITNDKAKQVVATLPADVSTHVAARGTQVPDEVRTTMVMDLTRQSEALAKSGLTVEGIRLRNEATLRAARRLERR